MKQIDLVIDNNVLSKYEEYYFKKHPRATKKPIENPYHESINVWMIMKRPVMNALKQKWNDFICWFVNYQGYNNLHIEKCDIQVMTYYKTNLRHDVDNSVIKFILDGFSESGLIIDDDMKHVESLLLQCGVDKDNPRTEITILIKE